MKRRLYQIYDLVARLVSGPPIIERADGPAIRIFHDVLSDQRTLPGQHPDDFTLMYVGEQSEETGELQRDDPVTVATGRQWAEGQRRAHANQEEGNGLAERFRSTAEFAAARDRAGEDRRPGEVGRPAQ